MTNSILPLNTPESVRKSAKKGGFQRKTSFYHMRENKVCINQEKAAQVLCVSVDDIKEWDLVGNPIAEMALSFWDTKHVNYHGWDGFVFSKDRLLYKKRIFTPKMLHSLHADLDANFRLQQQVNALTKELAELKAKMPYDGPILLSSSIRRG